ncbi:coproporphyrinogen dehydrogenase HemZ [Christensenella timonensis]|uniref:coproporphyrinogen dehydrogenase HemZ n=1 Tax=Christensenella timonensis TaxID=1816678 RepID=UPI00082FE724|nr:coproporphyrinogen dehydrogenase HemZ [Christensenella timonensis]
MFSLYTDTPEFYNDICDEIRLFVNEKKIAQVEKDVMSAGHLLRHFFWRDENGWHGRAEYYIDSDLKRKVETAPEFTEDGKAVDVAQDTLLAKKLRKHHVKGIVYEALHGYYGEDKPWGSLTGIRPTKLMHELAAKRGISEAKRIFRETYFVTEPKISLAETIVTRQEPYRSDIEETDVDIYVGIPFCISRCKYCSFISRDIKFNTKLKDQYMACLLHEFELMRDTLEKYRVRAVYVGGGTPTALGDEEFAQLLRAVSEYFKEPREFTVEAGRPDTITREKLDMIKAAGAGRISINAQTTNDDTLLRIGRRHDAGDFFRAFELAKTYGFDSINTDIILGLPLETTEDTKRTLMDVTRFEPENVTVHTLALKNSSDFALENQDLLDSRMVTEMVELSQQFLSEKGYLPYYLYRQKYMSGNMENVGFSQPGKESVYNIDIMEETVSVLAFGAGGISKKLYPEQNLLKRAANVKDIPNYIERTCEMADRKKELF